MEGVGRGVADPYPNRPPRTRLSLQHMRSCPRVPRRSEKKPESAPSATRRVLPMQLQVGDRFADETGEWEVVSRPYTSPGGKSTHAHVQRVGQPASSEVRTWGAFEHITMPRATAEKGKR